MDENANDAMQPLDDEAQHNNNPTQHQSNTTTATKTTSISTQDPPFIPTYNNTMQGSNNLTQQSNDAFIRSCANKEWDMAKFTSSAFNK